MKHELLLSGALANCHDLDIDEFLDFLKANIQEVEFYKLSPPKGTVYAASLDW